jgi:hypothetical protein
MARTEWPILPRRVLGSDPSFSDSQISIISHRIMSFKQANEPKVTSFPYLTVSIRQPTIGGRVRGIFLLTSMSELYCEWLINDDPFISREWRIDSSRFSGIL